MGNAREKRLLKVIFFECAAIWIMCSNHNLSLFHRIHIMYALSDKYPGEKKEKQNKHKHKHKQTKQSKTKTRKNAYKQTKTNISWNAFSVLHYLHAWMQQLKCFCYFYVGFEHSDSTADINVSNLRVCRRVVRFWYVTWLKISFGRNKTNKQNMLIACIKQMQIVFFLFLFIGLVF